ncbi:hypothetical protein [Citrobacter sp. Cb220]|uniref:hypothetical protein n=1 Tax=Citrobacter sp. Cb220 TaxID=2985034 RepID=UPI002578E293|nr:hypothetical protein [Citrobacter sp. Cb220]MDM3315961.1 hypothetical protein [Citrobacter sp. Cb220]
MKSIKVPEFNRASVSIGSDTLEKLNILHRVNYPSVDNDTLGLTISCCIELAYSALRSRETEGTDPQPLTPPKTKKAQEIYKLYQIVMTLKARGMNANKIVKYMNDNGHPTIEKLYSKKTSVEKWKVVDVDNLNNVEEVNSLIKLMNRRTHRPKNSYRNIKTS